MTRLTQVLLASFFVTILPSVTLAAIGPQACNAPQAPSTVYSSAGKIITFYVPHESPNCRTSVEGCNETSCVGLKDNLRKPTCLDAVRLGESRFVTVASDSSNWGKYYHFGTITYRSALDNQMHTVENVVGYVHDTGGAFRGRPDKLDVCTTVCAACTDAQAGALASGRNVGHIPSRLGTTDYMVASAGNSPLQTSVLYPAQSAFPASVGQNQTQFTSQSPAMQIGSQTLPPPSTDVAPNTQTLFPDGRHAASVLVQPTARIGAHVLVSWTSVNMEPASCRISAETVIGEGNQGSVPYVIVSASSTTFTLSCITAGGDDYTTSTSIPST